MPVAISAATMTLKLISSTLRLSWLKDVRAACQRNPRLLIACGVILSSLAGGLLVAVIRPDIEPEVLQFLSENHLERDTLALRYPLPTSQVQPTSRRL